MMRDKSDRYRIETVPLPTPPKRLGSYLVDAGLLTDDQVRVVLNDQQITGMRFGEVLVARGWLKEQTIEWVMNKVVLPERKAQQKLNGSSTPDSSPRSTAQSSAPPATPATSSAPRREAPMGKPLPPVKPPDGDVNWVG